MNLTQLNNCHLSELSQCEMENTQGGESAWYWVAYGVSSVIHGAWEVAQQAGAYQSSLAPCDKK